VPLAYVDSSALVRVILEERWATVLAAYLSETEIVSSELAIHVATASIRSTPSSLTTSARQPLRGWLGCRLWHLALMKRREIPGDTTAETRATP
jgi:hypothetical protein